MKTISFNLILLFALTLCLASLNMAQAEKCDIKLNVTKADSGIEIKGATATALNLDTKQAYKSVLRAGMPNFLNLPNANYRVTVTKAGFHRSADDFWLDCAEAENDWSIELYKGNPKLVVKLYENNTKYVVVGAKGCRQGPVGLRFRPRDLEETSITQTSESDIIRNMEPIPTLKPNETMRNVSESIAVGNVNGRATQLIKPLYPVAAKARRVYGAVNVQVTIDEEGNVISAIAVSGHPLLLSAAVTAARESKFSPTLISGQPVRVTGFINYNFMP